ncbi:MAG: amidohydrolase family protein [Anaerolineaceae bacterium]|nr:amidohydrolase family protein [Anaerolineaceae bacterium]
MYDLAVLGGKIYQKGKWFNANLFVKDGKIAKISNQEKQSGKKMDAAGKKVIPGLIDAHVHFAMASGSYMTADDFATGSLAAAYGGVTTFIDFLDEQNTAEFLKKEFHRKFMLGQKSCLDFGLHAAVCDLAQESAEAIAEAALGFGSPTVKLYTTYKPSAYSSPSTVRSMIKRSAKGDLLILCHAEKDELLSFSSDLMAHLPANRPAIAERQQVKEIAEYLRQLGGWAYIVHTSCGSTIAMLKNDFEDILGKNLFLEGCPQYFLLNEKVYFKPGAEQYAITPPLRSQDESLLLKQNLSEISVISTDHCLFLADQKTGKPLSRMPMGMPGVERSFGLMYALFGDRVIDRFTHNPAVLHGLFPQKGLISPGSDADLCIFHETSLHRYGHEHSAGDFFPYLDFKVNIEIDTVISRGDVIINDGKYYPHQGRYLHRKLDCTKIAENLRWDARVS